MIRRIAFVGVGHRATRFIDELATRHRDRAALAGFCDTSRVRMAAQNRWLQEKHGLAPVPEATPDGFESLLRHTRADTVVVATVDALHDEFIARALAAGCDVITEKPITIDAARCRRVLAAAANHPGRRITVAFNYRWAPTNTRVKELLAAGTIGSIKSVALEWSLDLQHGADYFRRWHSEKASSGGLLVHKATHHFDLVNWWTDAIPASVYAAGGLAFYGRANAVARGQGALAAYPRYTGEPAAQHDPFRLDLDANPGFRALYRAAESETGYLRDRNVFREGIDIEDHATVVVRYRTGLLLTYTLNAFGPREGMRVVFHGDRGRLEYYQFGRSRTPRRENDEGHVPGSNGHHPADAESPAWSTEQTFIRVYPHFAAPYSVPAVAGPGGHWGGDPIMIAHLLDGAPDPLGRIAGHEQGIASALVGIAANTSLAAGAAVALEDCLPLRPAVHRLSELV